MSKVSVKYYLNKNLKPYGGKYPVYIRVIHRRNPQRIASILFQDLYLNDEEFEDEIFQHIMRKGEKMILDCYDYFENNIIKDFDIRNYKGLRIIEVLGLFIEPFAVKYAEMGDFETVTRSVENFFNYINRELNINIYNTLRHSDEFEQRNFFETNIKELEKLGLVENVADLYFAGLNFGTYKYNITDEKDKYVISKAKEWNKIEEKYKGELERRGEHFIIMSDSHNKLIEENGNLYWCRQFAEYLYSENYCNFIYDEKLQKDFSKKGIDNNKIKQLLLKDIFNRIHRNKQEAEILDRGK